MFYRENKEENVDDNDEDGSREKSSIISFFFVACE